MKSSKIKSSGLNPEESYQMKLAEVRSYVLPPWHRRGRWSIRAAANRIGVSPRMITYVLSGKKRSQPVVDKLASLGKRPMKFIPVNGRLVKNPAWSGLRVEA